MIDHQQTEEMLEALADSSSETGLNHQFVRICENFFVDKFVIGTVFDLGNQEKKMDLFDTYPREWMEHYVKNQYFEHDKVLDWKNVRLPFGWKIDSLLDEASPTQKRLYQEAGDFGVCKGLIIPFISKDNEKNFLAVLDVVHPHPDMVHTLSLASQLYWATKRRLDAKSTLNLFTTREKEVLFLKSQGMPIKVVADRLAISESTVIFHVKNARQKLRATSIDHALYLFGRAVEQSGFSNLKKPQIHPKSTNASDKKRDFALQQLVAAA